MAALINLLIVILIVGLVVAVVVYCVRLLPIDGRFKQIAEVIVIIIGVLIVLTKALGLLAVV